MSSVISTSPTLNGKDALDDEEKQIAGTLEKYGLSWSAIESTNGELAAKSLPSILSLISDTAGTSSSVAICSALLVWHSTTSRNVKHVALFQKQADTAPIYRILSIIRNILSTPNDPLPTYKYGAQMPGLYLSQLLLRESKESQISANDLAEPIVKALDVLWTGPSITLREEPTSSTVITNSTPSPGPDSTRVETVKNLIKCIPMQCKSNLLCQV